jgi:hypothetical protein
MSMLRSVLYEEFPFVDNWGDRAPQKASIHIAASGQGDDLIHIGVDEWSSEARINVDIAMAEKIVTALQLLIDNYYKNRGEQT